MAVFRSSEDMYEVFTPYYQRLTTDPEIGPKFVAARTSFRLNLTDPDGTFILDCTTDPAVLLVGAEAVAGTPEIELTMSADDGHRFWLGGLNLPIALAKRKIKISGPIPKLMGLLPALQPAYAKYRDHLREIGRDALV